MYSNGFLKYDYTILSTHRLSGGMMVMMECITKHGCLLLSDKLREIFLGCFYFLQFLTNVEFAVPVCSASLQ